MKMIIWAKPCWADGLKTAKRFGLLVLLVCQSALAQVGQVDFNPSYVWLSDALTAVKNDDPQSALAHLNALEQSLAPQLTTLPQDDAHQSAWQAYQSALQASQNAPSLETLGTLSKALYAFERTVKPVDYAAKREKFSKRVMPVYRDLDEAVAAEEVDKALEIYARFNRTWTANEKTVRDTSLGHYGKIEGAMNFLRIALASTPPNLAEAKNQSALLGAALKDFESGAVLDVAPSEVDTLSKGVALLQSALQNLDKSDFATAQNQLVEFMNAWVIFEGSVRTRDAGLYSQTESALPLLVANIQAPQSREQLAALIAALGAIDEDAHYGVLDAMLVLLREGLEALLIIMALVTALQKIPTPVGKKPAASWIYTGALVGVLASIVAALALHYALPAQSAGTSREIIEGGVGIMAVVMMLLVGGWLHSKSSLAGWQTFLNQQMHKALSENSFMGMAGLAFLSVFREGAETLLFYAGMLPKMAMADLWLGIVSAVAILALVAVLITQGSRKLPIHKIFGVMTLCMYLLGFKILGVSVHTLQLMQVMPTHALHLPTWDFIGWYATQEGLIAQIVFLAMIPVVRKLFR